MSLIRRNALTVTPSPCPVRAGSARPSFGQISQRALSEDIYCADHRQLIEGWLGLVLRCASGKVNGAEGQRVREGQAA